METTIIPIQFKAAAPKKIDIIPTGKIGKLEFAKMSVKDGDTDVNVTEDHLEEFVRRHVDLVFSQEEEETEQTLLIVGQQVRDKEGRRSDLVALDSEGCVLLIEIKRDRKDMEARKEPLEFQAVRYAANYALITTPEDLVDKLFAPYIKKHWDEYHEHHKTETQLGREILEGFLTGNKIEELDFNQRQRIVLIASDFDDETLSACAWLCKNKVDLRCLTISPFKYSDQYYLKIEQKIPPPPLDSYFVEVAGPSQGVGKASMKHKAAKEYLPRMPWLFEKKLVNPGDKVYIKGFDSKTAEVVNAQQVRFEGKIMAFNDWGKAVTGWSSINVYQWTYLLSNRKSLDELRRAKMDEDEEHPLAAST